MFKIRSPSVSIHGNNIKRIKQSPWGMLYDNTLSWDCYAMPEMTEYLIVLRNETIIEYDTELFINNISVGTWKVKCNDSITISQPLTRDSVMHDKAPINSKFMFKGKSIPQRNYEIISVIFNPTEESAIRLCGRNPYPLKPRSDDPKLRNIGNSRAERINIKLVPETHIQNHNNTLYDKSQNRHLFR